MPVIKWFYGIVHWRIFFDNSIWSYISRFQLASLLTPIIIFKPNEIIYFHFPKIMVFIVLFPFVLFIQAKFLCLLICTFNFTSHLFLYISPNVIIRLSCLYYI